MVVSIVVIYIADVGLIGIMMHVATSRMMTVSARVMDWIRMWAGTGWLDAGVVGPICRGLLGRRLCASCAICGGRFCRG